MPSSRAMRIENICQLEWEMFSRVRNCGGPAACQKDAAFFKKMRSCQFAVWSDALLASYEADLREARDAGRNLPAEKYAWMMEDTHPEEFARLAPLLPRISPQQRKLIETIVNIQIVWEREVDRRFPGFRAGGRPLTKDGDCRGGTSFETYLAGELKTCSVRTLRQYVRHIREIQRKGGNLALEVAENMARAYGHETLLAAEASLHRRQTS